MCLDDYAINNTIAVDQPVAKVFEVTISQTLISAALLEAQQTVGAIEPRSRRAGSETIDLSLERSLHAFADAL